VTRHSPAPVSVSLTVNGETQSRLVEPRRTLADFLREDLDLTGTHLGCEEGVCGACTVLLDGQPVRSCLLFAVQAHHHDVTTIEGLSANGRLTPLQRALQAQHGLQCGFCTPGVVVGLTALLRAVPKPSEADVRQVLGGHLCRCTGYAGIVAAALDAVDERRDDSPSGPVGGGVHGDKTP
jgi:aerobic carbon-monoxide dehydrogenase small subunit